MFEVLKPIIEKNKLFDSKITDLCEDIQEEIRHIEKLYLPQGVQDRLDNISNLIDCLESDHDFTLESEIDDLKESFHKLDKEIIVHRNYMTRTDEEIRESIDEFFKWSN